MPRARKVRHVYVLHPDGWREVHIVWRLPGGQYKARLSGITARARTGTIVVQRPRMRSSASTSCWPILPRTLSN